MTKSSSLFLTLIVALIGISAALGAYWYRLKDPSAAAGLDALLYLALTGLGVAGAKVNLAQSPQKQNTAIAAAAAAGFFFAAMIDRLFSLALK